MTKSPPVPKENRSSKGPGSIGSGDQPDAAADDTPQALADQKKNPEQQGQAANTKQNTDHMGGRQGRRPDR